PYFNGKSQSISKEIDEFTKDYKKDLNERKINLDDLYIKFIRFAEWKINKAGFGVVGIITNNSFLDGVTHRQMRKHLMGTFDEIYILNLHGNTRKGETDKNIFDIMVGVSINIFVKYQTPLKDKKVYYYSTLDNGLVGRAEKLDMLATKSLSSVKWQQLNPAETDNCFFVKKDLSKTAVYENFYKITDIFDNYNSGIQSKNDVLTIQYRKKNIENIINDFKTLPIEHIKNKYLIEAGVWTAEKALKSLTYEKFDISKINKIGYRPFDIRYTFLNTKSSGFLARPRYETMKHFIKTENIGLCFTRSFNDSTFNRVFISKDIVDLHIHSDQSYIAPLYLYQNDFGLETKTPNFTAKFQKEYLSTLPFKPTPEDILNYIYAVLHCPLYRETYLEFLKTDFPAVPMTKDEAVFKKYAALGKQLVALHTMQDIPKDKEIREEFDGEISNFVISKIEPPTKAQHKLTLTATDGKKVIFNGITPDIYSFKIGSYSPIEKWLKYRKADAVILGIEDLAHIKSMIIVLKHTMEIMEQIKALNADYLKEI
ncbi:MAG: N-6 DNA methylase, partial [Elusimicrobiota bacterium]|nr:N-6 DNA methylase [Elusimicrobiota bacterium]